MVKWIWYAKVWCPLGDFLWNRGPSKWITTVLHIQRNYRKQGTLYNEKDQTIDRKAQDELENAAGNIRNWKQNWKYGGKLSSV